MKKIFSNNRLIAFAFFTVFAASAPNGTQASEPHPSVPVELRFIGNIQNQPVFQLSFTGNPLQDEFTIFISDEFGNSFYRENIKGENFSKKFLLNTNEIGDNSVRFEIMCKRTRRSVIYEVNRNTRFEEGMVINELK